MAYKQAITAKLAERQEAALEADVFNSYDDYAAYQAGRRQRAPATPRAYRIYTESFPGNIELVARYFKGATVYRGIGIWRSSRELADIIEIVGTTDDMQAIAHLAGDIKQVNRQTNVLVTWSDVGRLDV